MSAVTQRGVYVSSADRGRGQRFLVLNLLLSLSSDLFCSRLGSLVPCGACSDNAVLKVQS